jgi:hypothetical protein
MGALSMKRLTGTVQPTTNGDLHGQDEQSLAYRSTSRPVSRFHCWEAERIRCRTRVSRWQSARKRQGRSTAQLIAHIPVREAPQRPKEGDELQRLLRVGTRAASRTGRQRRWAVSMRQAYGDPSQGKQMQTSDQWQGILTRGRLGFRLRPLRGGRRDKNSGQT